MINHSNPNELHSFFSPLRNSIMGNVLSDGGVDKNDINEIKLITLSDSYSPADPIWDRVFDLKGYLQYVNHSYLESICVCWSRDMSGV